MSRKINPNAFRLGVTMPWINRWFYKKSLKIFLEEDCLIRAIAKKKLPKGSVAGIDIERTREDINIAIKSNRPGLIIGRGGKGVEELRNQIMKEISKLRKERKFDLKPNLNVNVVEMSRTELSAQVIASQVASDLERRLPFRTVMKQHLRAIKQNRDIGGARLKLAGRLNGADIARSEHLDFGRMPLTNLRAIIDYGQIEAFTTYGIIGIKVWLYKGEVFDEE